MQNGKRSHHANKTQKAYFRKIGFAVIVKPAVSGGSMGVGVKNVVHTMKNCISRCKICLMDTADGTLLPMA
jgi:biotin carboxylase